MRYKRLQIMGNKSYSKTQMGTLESVFLNFSMENNSSQSAHFENNGKQPVVLY